MSRSSIVSFALVACALLSAAGCNAPGKRAGDTAPLEYWPARGYDFMDMFWLNVSAGPGLHAAAAVEPVRIGFGTYEASKAGMMGRAFGTWEEERDEFWLGLHDLLCWCKKPCCGNRYLWTPEVIHRHSHVRESSDNTRLRFYEKWNWTTRYEDWEKPWLDLTLQAHLLYVGLDLGFSVQQAADFVLGLFTVDAVSHDDFAAKTEGLEYEEPAEIEHH